MDPNEWLLLFLHELLHELDQDIKGQWEVHNRIDWVNTFKKWEYGYKVTDPNKLPPKIKSQLEKFVRAALTRELWGEYRAYVVSLRMYEAGLKEKLWKKIPWVEPLRKGANQAENYNLYIYNTLVRNSFPPSEGLYTDELIENMIQSVLTSYTIQNTMPPMGYLNKMLEGLNFVHP